MTNDKYEFTGKTKLYGNVTLHQIRALKDIKHIKAGTIGGWIEKFENLNTRSNCWLHDDARIFGNAIVSYDAYVSGNACIFGNARICDNAHISDDVCIYDNAVVSNNAHISGSSRICGNAYICRNVSITPININGTYYKIDITDNHIKIDYKIYTIDEWENFTDKDILEIDGKSALEFWKQYKSIIISLAKLHNSKVEKVND